MWNGWLIYLFNFFWIIFLVTFIQLFWSSIHFLSTVFDSQKCWHFVFILIYLKLYPITNNFVCCLGKNYSQIKSDSVNAPVVVVPWICLLNSENSHVFPPKVIHLIYFFNCVYYFAWQEKSMMFVFFCFFLFCSSVFHSIWIIEGV